MFSVWCLVNLSCVNQLNQRNLRSTKLTINHKRTTSIVSENGMQRI